MSFHLAVELDGDGAHPAAWRRSQHGPAELLTGRRTAQVTRRAENAGFTLATFDDALTPPTSGPVGRIGAVERAAFAAPQTSSIGLAPVVATTYTEPFHLASQVASLDHASLGRAGWVVAAATEPAAAWGRTPVTGDGLAREARDAVAVARDLFDSWGDDAAIRDVATGRYLDRAQLHYIDFVGETYTVKGPAIVPRPPQGHVVVIAPDGLVPSPDVALVTTPARVGAPLTFLELDVALDTDVSAAERLAALDAHTPWPATGRPRHVGSAAALVEWLTELAGQVDGVRLHPLVLDEDLPVLSARVLPALFEARIATRPRDGASLRSTLGLARPANRFEVTRVTDFRFPDAQLHFGVFFQGVNHWTIWSHPDSGSQIDFASFRRMVQTAERGLFDAFFLGEGLRLRESGGQIHDLDVAGRPDAITQLAALAAVTERIGLVATQNTTYNEPADLARRLAGLDVLSGGRAGWNVVTTDNAWTGENFRRGGYLDHADRYVRAGQFLDVARAVWDGWADDWQAADGSSWARPDAVTGVRTRTSQFDVDIVPTLPRSAQGHPVIFQAGDSASGRDFAAAHAEVIFSAHGADYDDALAFADDLRERLIVAGRPSDDLRVLPGTEIVIADTEEEAKEKQRWIRLQQVTPATALAIAGQVWGFDLTGRDADGPLPTEEPVFTEPTGEMGSRRWTDPRSIVAQWREVAESEKLSLRETVIRLGPQRGHAGTPGGLAEKFAYWVRSGAVDGFNVSPYLTPDGLDDIVEKLVPELQERGVYRTAYSGTTLREHLDLRPPLTRR